VPAHWKLVGLHTTAGLSVLPTATVAIRRPDGEIVQDAAIGDGPVDAIFKAVERVTGVRANLREFVVRSVSQGKDAQGEVTLELEVESGDRAFHGRAASTDIIEASAQAYLNAVNAIAAHKERGHVREVIGRPGAGA
jgi:2-isopropylmalate synthase